MKGEFKNFAKFFFGNKKLLLFCGLLVLAAYGILVFTYSISLDTEFMLGHGGVANTNNWQLMLSRWALVAMRKIFGVGVLCPHLANFAALLELAVYAMLWNYVFFKFSGKIDCKNYIFSGFLIVSSIHAEFFTFTMQNAELAFMMILAVFSAHIFAECIAAKKKSPKPLAFALLSMVAVFGSYQPLTVFWVECFLAIVLWRQRHGKFDATFASLLKSALLFFAAYAAHLLVAKAVSLAMHLPRTDYLSGRFSWGKFPLSAIFGSIKHEVAFFCKKSQAFAYKSYIPLAAASLAISISESAAKRRPFVAVATLALFAMPFAILVALGCPQAYRVYLGIPLCVAASYCLLLDFLEIKNLKKIAAVLLALCAFAVLRKVQYCNQLLYSHFVSYNQDVALSHKIALDIQKLLNKRTIDVPCVLYGTIDSTIPPSGIRGERWGALSHSFFISDLVDGNRWPSFMRTLGYDLPPASREFIDAANERAKDMPCWPDPLSIQMVAGGIVVKVSDEHY